MVYNFRAIEKKWQRRWEKARTFVVKESAKKKKYYVLDMFPYPSGAGLHMGHAFVFSLGDIFARFKRLQGFNVLYPLGYDSLGLPAENAAISAGVHPKEYTKKAIANFQKQQKAMGWSYDWSRVLQTSDPLFYRWDQWIFLEMLKRGIAYRKKAPVNWCSKCESVLANEQVVNGCCWRHEDTSVEVRHLEQWFLKITDYAEELLEGLDTLEWPERAKKLQRNWIGRSEGAEITFEVEVLDKGLVPWPIFTTRPDTLFGVTFLVVAAGHDRLNELVTDEQRGKVDEYLKRMNSVSEKDIERREKEGVFSGSYAVNPANGENVPIWIGNFVLADYGSGMVMGVPAHDKRDWAFAKKYGIEIRQVVAPSFLDHDNPPREDAKNTKRNIIHAILLSKKGDKFVALRNKKLPWLTPVTGGIDDGESALEAAIREIKEETGYQNFELFKEMPYKMHASFYAAHKNLNRSVISSVFAFKLTDEKKEPLSKEEAERHDVEWLPISKLSELTPVSELPEILKWFNGGSGAYVDSGILINSGKFDGMDNVEAKDRIVGWLAKKGDAKKVVNFKLRDWGVSRQRYWGTPIPIVYCDSCGVVPVPEKELPVELPKDVKFGGGNPLETAKDWINVKCPKCGGKARRETDTMDTFANSSWYYLRYTDPKNEKKIFETKKANYWCPVDQYIGGPEHITMHLVYARFYAKFLRDLGLVSFDEPAKRYFTQGIVHASDGEKMSKSKGNVIEPLDFIEKYGADTLRLALVSFASPDTDTRWDEAIVKGSHKFLTQVYDYFSRVSFSKMSDVRLEHYLHKTINDVTSFVEGFKHNLATIALRDLFNRFTTGTVTKKNACAFLALLHPYCPFVTEELWGMIGGKGFLSSASWPVCDEKRINQRFEKEDEAREKIVSDVVNILNIIEARGKAASTVYVYTIPSEKGFYDSAEISKRVGKEVKIFAVNDKDKYDPTNKGKGAKPGKPGIYVE